MSRFRIFLFSVFLLFFLFFVFPPTNFFEAFSRVIARSEDPRGISLGATRRKQRCYREISGGRRVRELSQMAAGKELLLRVGEVNATSGDKRQVDRLGDPRQNARPFLGS